VTGLRIGIFHQSVGRYGGAERLCLDVAQGILNRGHEVELFWNEWFLPVQSLMFRYPQLIPHTRLVPWKLHNLRELERTAEACDAFVVMYHVNPRLGWLLTRRLKHRVPLIWYAGEPNRGLWERWITDAERSHDMKALFCNTVGTIYGSLAGSLVSAPPFYWLSTGLLRMVDYSYVRGFDHVIAQSHCVAELLRKIYKIRHPTVIHPGVDPNRFAAINTENNKYETLRRILGTKYFLSVGALEKYKNHDVVIRAFKVAVSQTGRRDFRLIILGTGKGGQHRHLLDLASSDGLPNVEVLDWDPTDLVGVLYGSCTAVIHTALWEPFGLTPIEGALFGKPSIVSRTGGVAETVIDRQTGILVNPHDISSISGAVQDLMQSESLCRKMGKNARAHVLTNFTLSRTVEDLLRFVSTLPGG